MPKAKTTKPALKKPPETANRITANILKMINMQPNCSASRISNVGIWDEKNKTHRKSQTTKGVADVIACIRGRYVELEVKAGRDKPSVYQLQHQQEIQRAKGVYEFIYSTDQFEAWFTEFLKQT
jgi:hypothetical protein